MPDKENLMKVLDESILTMEIVDPTVVWFSERLEWLADKLLNKGVIMPCSAEWLPYKPAEGWRHDRRYTHYCSKCGQGGFGDFPRCPKCASNMGFEKEEPILEKEMSM